MKNKKSVKEWAVYEIKNCLNRNWEQFKKNNVLSLDIIQNHLNKDILINSDIDFSKDEDFEYISNLIKNHEYNLTDFELTKDGLKRKDYKPFTTEFKTSGKIIVENDLREYFENDDDFDVNSSKGKIQTMEYYNNQGMLHGFVGNSCPSLYLSKKHGKILIGSDYTKFGNPKLPDKTYKKLTSVCTDLWWYSIVDAEEFFKLHPNENVENFNVVEIPAGTWILEHKYGISEIGYHENLPYATLTLKN